jgi:hypothetical protein
MKGYYKVPFRHCYSHRIFGKWGWIHYTLYCLVWLKLGLPPASNS